MKKTTILMYAAIAAIVLVSGCTGSQNAGGMPDGGAAPMAPQGGIEIVALNETTETDTIFMVSGNEACILHCLGSCQYKPDDMRQDCAVYFGTKEGSA